MRIQFHKKFIKAYDNLSQHQQEVVDRAITLFSVTSHHQKLRNHALKGKEFKGVRSIDASFDVRILYREYADDFVVVMIDVGSHSQLYS